MPDYTIHIHRGPDTASHRVSLPDVDEARREASGVFADLARDIVGNLPDQLDSTRLVYRGYRSGKNGFQNWDFDGGSGHVLVSR